MTPDPIRKLDGTDDGAFLGSYIDYVENPTTTITTSFGRVVDTGSGEDLSPKGNKAGQSYSGNRYVTRQYLSVEPGNHRVGAFFCNSTRLNEGPSYIPTIILASEAYIKPEKQTQTISFGETVTIRMNFLDGNVTDLRWRLNENIIESWSGMVNVTIQYVTKTDAGIYECYLINRRNEGKHAIMRLIVRGCSASRWGPDCQNLCPTCYNGGVCDDVTGLCVCRPGFKETDCSFGCGNNNWGITCSLVCSSSSPGCPGVLGCVPDPVGCSCMAGYKGLDCKEGCETVRYGSTCTGCEVGRYGSTCSEECHCAADVQCDPSTGCPDGPCVDGYSGINCQVPDTCPEGWYGELCKYHCHCEDDGPCYRSTGSCGERKCRHLWVGSDCQLDGRTNVNLIIPESNQGASVTITCIVHANPIPNEEDIHVLNNDDVSLVSGVFTVTEDNYTRTVVYSAVNVTKGDVFKCQVSSNVSGDAHVEKSVTIYDPPVLTTSPSVTASDSIVTVSWNQWTDAGDGNGDGPVIGYDLCYIMSGSSSGISCIGYGLHLTASFDINSIGFQRGIDYDFGVGAKRPGSLGTGPVSPLTTFTIPCLSPGVVPSIVTVSSLSTSEIQVNWQLIDSEHWRCNSLDYYKIEYKQSEDESFQEITVSSTDTTATISNLDPCTTYHIQVTATNSAGGGPSSDIVTVTTDIQEPGDLVLHSVIPSPTSLTVNWIVPNDPECITSFNVDYTLINLDQCNTSVDIAESQIFSPDSTQGILTNLWSNSLYRLQVYAVFGSSATQPAEIEANTSTSKPTGPPLDVSILDLNETELSFAWQLPECGRRNGPITKYKARLKNNYYTTNAEVVTETSVTFSSLSPCTEYTFKVRAVDGIWSEELLAKTASQAPDIVQDITISGADTSLVVSWEAPVIQDCQIDFYKVEYQLENQGLCGANSGSVTETLHTTETSIVIDNLEVYSLYSVTVSAVIGQVEGTHNFEGTGTTEKGITDEGEPIVGPENILGIISQEATNEAPGAIEISFGSVPCLQKGGVILNYKVQVIGGDGGVLGNPSTAGATPAIITGVYPCQSVTPQVAACTLAGCGEFASGSTVTMNPAAPGIVSVNVQPVPYISERLFLSWSASDVIYCPIVEYKIEYRYTLIDQCLVDIGEYEVEFVDGVETMTTLTGLLPFTTYDVTVSAGVVGRNGRTIFTHGGLGYGYTEPAAPIRGPKELNVTAVSATEASFAWSEIECGYRRGPIIGYKFSIQPADGQEDTVTDDVTSQLECDASDLKPFTQYIFSVKGYNPMGDGGSKELQITTDESIPTVPQKIKIVNTDTESFRIEWSRPQPPNGIVISYQINYTVVDGLENMPQSFQYTVSDEERHKIDFSYTVENLQEKTNYSVQAAAFTSVGIGPWSGELHVFTITGKPGYVHNLTILYVQERAIMLSWEQPLNPNGVITNYYIQYRLLEKVFEPDAGIQLEWSEPIELDGDVEEYLLSSLEPATKYEIKVFAKTSAGEGEPMNITQITLTPPAAREGGTSIGLIIGVLLSFLLALLVLAIVIKLKRRYRHSHGNNSMKGQVQDDSLKTKGLVAVESIELYITNDPVQQDIYDVIKTETQITDKPSGPYEIAEAYDDVIPSTSKREVTTDDPIEEDLYAVIEEEARVTKDKNEPYEIPIKCVGHEMTTDSASKAKPTPIYTN